MSILSKKMIVCFVFSGLIFFVGSIGSGQVLSMTHDHAGMEQDNEHQVQSEFDFLVEMIPHHQEAVDSSREIKAITDRPELREFAREVIKAQKQEIREMEEWLELWYPEKDVQHQYQPMMRDFEELSVEETEKAFLEDMILHHEMAVVKARDLLDKELARHPETEDMARSIIKEQEKEVELMQKWLNEWF